MTVLRSNVADLLHHPGARRPWRLAAPVEGLRAGTAVVADDAPVDVDVVLERVPEGIIVRGTFAGHWSAECSRCLAPANGVLQVGVQELYEHDAVDGETYPLDGDELDLEPLLRDAVLLELPSAPLCRPDCAGLCPVCGVDRNRATCSCDTSVRDSRWDALENLKF
ncbi:MAG: YceD family protein [Acidimicrobiia bacterium]